MTSPRTRAGRPPGWPLRPRHLLACHLAMGATLLILHWLH
jgi:hypothetical protein